MRKDRPALSGFVLILISTVIAGLAGYAITWFVYRRVGASQYALFMVFWSSLYLVVGALSGVQQEITRATRPRRTDFLRGASRSRNFGFAAALLAFILIAGSSPLWMGSVFRGTTPLLAVPLAFGATAYVLVATLSGALYGIERWKALAWIVAIDGVLRLVSLVAISLVTTDLLALAWSVVLPFAVTPMIVWPFIRGGVVGKVQTDVGYRKLTWNVSRTILAAASTAFLVSGFPLLLRVTSSNAPAAAIGVLILAITLTRAPLIVTVMALQSYLVVRFRDFTGNFQSFFLRIEALVLGGGILLALSGCAVGPTVFEILFGHRTKVDGLVIGILILSSALVAALSVSSSAVLAKSQHVVYSIGWLVAAVTTVVLLLLPLGLVPRVLVTLIGGPLAGLVVHALYLLASKANGRARREGFGGTIRHSKSREALK